MPAVVEFYKGGYCYASSYAENIHVIHKIL